MTFEEQEKERYRIMKLTFCKYTLFKPEDVLKPEDFNFEDWNQFRRVCFETGCTEEGLLEALKVPIKLEE